MAAWKGRGNVLPQSFAALRVETNQLWIQSHERFSGPDAHTCQLHSATDPVQLLCRAVRLAPACYRRFVWTAADPAEPLHVNAAVRLSLDGMSAGRHPSTTATFECVKHLDAAVQQCAIEEHVNVSVSPDERSIVIIRDDLS